MTVPTTDAMRVTVTRVILTLTPAVLLDVAIVLLWRATGGPPSAALPTLLSGSRFSIPTGAALSELVMWVCLLVVAGYVSLSSAIRAAGAVARRGLAIRGATLVALIGLAVLIVGLARHESFGMQVCCGSVQEARDALGR